MSTILIFAFIRFEGGWDFDKSREDKIANKYVKTIMEFIKNKNITSANIEYDIDNFKLVKVKNIQEVNGELQLKPKRTKVDKVVEVVDEEDIEIKQTPKKAKAKAPTKKKKIDE
jgi:hypothetical protein